MTTTMNMSRERIIGVDFDNTLVTYDELLNTLAVRRGLILPTLEKTKKNIRDQVRLLPDGEIEWQKLQALVYGPRMNEARLVEGVRSFFEVGKRNKLKVYIISHKTEFANYDETHTNLRTVALDWMVANKFFQADGLGLSPEAVFFSTTRQEKIELIRQLGCTHFIDDLEETFLERTFPANVEKILYAPHHQSVVLPGVKVVATWQEISEYLFGADKEMDTEEIKRIAARLLNGDVMSIEPIGGGRNSQVYRLIGADSQTYALKVYFRHSSDERDRLRTEFSSLSFLWENGIREIPKPLVADREHGCALYEYIDGQKIVADAITNTEVDAAALFLAHLKDLKGRAESCDLALAAEACFSVQAIVENIQRRLSRLSDHRISEESYADLYEFLDHHLVPSLEEIVRWCQASVNQACLSFDLDIDLSQRTLSPSDFGFHNALKRNNGQLVFVDFEYFGWDDPAKMVADVLLHPGMTLAESLKRRFVQGILQGFADCPHLAKRLEIVYPLFGLKWCLILLNEFLPEHLLRRQFASTNGFQQRVLQSEQLAKARRMLRTIDENYEHFSYFD